jgi:hypothetical protein
MFKHHLGACCIRALGKGFVYADLQRSVQCVAGLDDSSAHHTGGEHR